MSSLTHLGLTTLPPPQPVPDFDTAPFWEATAEERLAMCRCQDCGLWHQPPLERCRRCAALTAFETVSGLGTIYTFIVQRQPAVVGYLDPDSVPYVVALVELDEQERLRLPARIVGIDPERVSVGLRVRAKVIELPGGSYKVAVFEPAAL